MDVQLLWGILHCDTHHERWLTLSQFAMIGSNTIDSYPAHSILRHFQYTTSLIHFLHIKVNNLYKHGKIHFYEQKHCIFLHIYYVNANSKTKK